jgi:hypothetical protein
MGSKDRERVTCSILKFWNADYRGFMISVFFTIPKNKKIQPRIKHMPPKGVMAPSHL